jgi:sortase A
MLITAGIVVLIDVGITLAYKEPISSVYAEIQQSTASDQLRQLESQYPTAADERAIAGVHGLRAKVRVLARRFEPRLRTGHAIGRIIAPAMDGLNEVFVQGTDTSSLEKGPGHYPQTPLPGEGGTVAIAGHRTTYLAPFRHIDSMHRGDEVRLEMPYATLTYRVQATNIVDPGDVEIVRRVGYERLVLTACQPLYSASQRFVVFAKLARVALFDAAHGGRWPAN